MFGFGVFALLAGIGLLLGAGDNLRKILKGEKPDGNAFQTKKGATLGVTIGIIVLIIAGILMFNGDTSSNDNKTIPDKIREQAYEYWTDQAN